MPHINEYGSPQKKNTLINLNLCEICKKLINIMMTLQS